MVSSPAGPYAAGRGLLWLWNWIRRPVLVSLTGPTRSMMRRWVARAAWRTRSVGSVWEALESKEMTRIFPVLSGPGTGPRGSGPGPFW